LTLITIISNSTDVSIKKYLTEKGIFFGGEELHEPTLLGRSKPGQGEDGRMRQKHIEVTGRGVATKLGWGSRKI
jgi:hypothetical protein